MNLETFSYGTVNHGQSAGALGFSLHTQEGDDWDISEILDKIRSTATGPMKLVRISGGAREEELRPLVQTLGESGYIIQGITDGGIFPGWFSLCHHRIVTINSPQWLGFSAGELWMKLNSTVAPADPVLPGGKLQNTVFYLDTSNADPAEVFRYTLKSKIPWAVLPRAVNSIQRNLLGEG